jgi:hypothetical protein
MKNSTLEIPPSLSSCFYILIFCFETTWAIGNKLGRNVYCMVSENDAKKGKMGNWKVS